MTRKQLIQQGVISLGDAKKPAKGKSTSAKGKSTSKETEPEPQEPPVETSMEDAGDSAVM